MYKLIRGHEVLYVISLILIILYSIVDIVKSILMSYILDYNLLNSVQTLILIVSCFMVIYLIFITSQQYVVELLKNKIRYSLNQKLYRSYISKNISAFQEKDSSQILNEFNNEVNIVVEQYVSSKLNIFSLTVSLLLGSIYIASLSIEILLFLLFCAFITIFVNNIFKNRLEKNQKRYLTSMESWLFSIKNLCRCFKDMKILNLEETFNADLDAKNKKLEKSTLQNNGFLKVINALNSSVSQIMFFGTLVVGIVLIYQKQLSVGELLGIVQASNMVIMPITNYANFRSLIISSKPVLKKLESNSIIYVENVPIVLKDDIKVIKFHNLSFDYDGRKILDSVNLEINQGKKYLIIGKSGAGKSTFLDILTKQKSTEGIYVNGENLKNIVFSTYTDKYSYVNQNNDLLPFSFEENITLGKEETAYSLQELISKFHLESVFNNKRENLDIEHQNLSGGEKQRICLARALYRNKKFLILDEAFSAIDKKISDGIHQFILSEPDITVLSIEHKITQETVLLYDEVLLFENKKIIPMSTEEYLNSGSYRQEFIL